MMRKHMESIRRRFIAVTLLSWALGCSSGTKSPDIDVSVGPEPQSGLETLVVLGTNDIHGGLAPFSLITRETGDTPSVSYEAGGAAVLASYVNILRDEFKDHFIW